MSEDKGEGVWGFYSLLAKMGAAVLVFGGLFLLARTGDPAAIALLAALVTLTLLGLGLWAAVVLLDRQGQAEERRFRANAKENYLFLEQQQRLLNSQLAAQGRQTSNLLRQQEQLTRLLPNNGNLDVDSLTWGEDLESEL